MKNILCLALAFPWLFAAIPKETINEKVASALRDPHSIAVQSIKALGEPGVARMEEMAFNDKWPMKVRWKAFMVASHVQGKQSLPFIKKALVSPTWFMRSAGLTALQSLNPQGAKKWAYQLLHSDPALMVRMKALDILKSEKSEKVTELFWQKLNSPDSQHRNKSLWIRTDIAQLLMKNPRKQDLKRWVGLLHDSDKDLQQIASFALQKLHKSSDETESTVGFWKDKFPSKKL